MVQKVSCFFEDEYSLGVVVLRHINNLVQGQRLLDVSLALWALEHLAPLVSEEQRLSEQQLAVGVEVIGVQDLAKDHLADFVSIDNLGPRIGLLSRGKDDPFLQAVEDSLDLPMRVKLFLDALVYHLHQSFERKMHMD